MNKTNVIIGAALGLALVAALLVLLYGLGTDALLGAVVIVDGVSSPEWFDSIKPIAF